MNDLEFRILLDLYMVSDPWPLDDSESNNVIGGLLNRESKKRGFDGWIVAFHQFKLQIGICSECEAR